MEYSKPVIEAWSAVGSIEDSNEKPGTLQSDAPFVGQIGTPLAYQADE